MLERPPGCRESWWEGWVCRRGRRLEAGASWQESEGMLNGVQPGF